MSHLTEWLRADDKLIVISVLTEVSKVRLLNSQIFSMIDVKGLVNPLVIIH